MKKRWIYIWLLTAALLGTAACGSAALPGETNSSQAGSETTDSNNEYSNENSGESETENAANYPVSAGVETAEAFESISNTDDFTEAESEESGSLTTPDNGFAEETSSAAETTPTAEETMYTTGSSINIRDAAGMEGQIIGTLPKGKAVTVIGTEGEWSQILFEGKTCYVSSRYLSKEAPEAGLEEPETQSGTASNREPQAGTGIYHEGGDLLVCIDAGHQDHPISEKEPNGPGSGIMKAKATSGTDGCTRGTPEYQVNLQVALKLRDELLARGYSVLMTREVNSVEISNAERATLANDYGADMMIRLHCNSIDNPSPHGALGIIQTRNNPYCGNIYSDCKALTNSILDSYCDASGFKNTGIWETDEMTGTNWCQVPNTILEMGYMSNADDDAKLCDENFQYTMARGIADGIDDYFGR